MTRTVTIEEVQGRPIEELLRETAQRQETLRIKMTNGEAVEIRPLPTLKPLTRLEGYIPSGWKNAVYEPR